MTLRELLPTVERLSHQDKLRLIHFLLLAVAREEGYNLESTEKSEPETSLLDRLAATEAVVWSPQADSVGVQALSDLLDRAKAESDA
ncbi:hypothetical protein V0288_06365 [Pannus brasiliensis CCIBt3594]|uniref:Uncharacterized protein n=1 Tax=Pannus brasiliensis CCIBt3594 TaxID=1427578 RepID=A0AAW9QI41_9CHRO